MRIPGIAFLLLSSLHYSEGFSSPAQNRASRQKGFLHATATAEVSNPKEKLLRLVQRTKIQDDVLADPITKEPLLISSSGVLVGGQTTNANIKYALESSQRTYSGTANTYIDLLPVASNDSDEVKERVGDSPVGGFISNVVPFIPPPIRSALATAGAPMGLDYVPMRDLFTSPAVSIAYERGWRQGFSGAGFPGADAEAEMAMEYFAPVIAALEAQGKPNVLVDMSCATGLFTRRFASSKKYDRVIACDYSASMLEEARRRIGADSFLSRQEPSKLSLVRCDVEQIPMQTESVDVFHAGAAMHCWPDLPQAVSEIYRVLKPGGRYFATTFLSVWFGRLQDTEGGATGPSRQAFQYFDSVDHLRSLLESGGFAPEKVQVELIGSACVVIRCEK